MYYFMMDILFVTGNKSKLNEVQRILGKQFNVSNRDFDIPEIQSVCVTDVVKDKVKKAYEIAKVPVMCEDTGLYINKMNGFPGALIKFYYASLKNEKISEINGGSLAYAKTSICYYDGTNTYTFEGIVNGRISTEVKGTGFGWDPIFIPEGYDFSFAECPPEMKDKVSMRGIALRKMMEYFKNLNNSIA